MKFNLVIFICSCLLSGVVLSAGAQIDISLPHFTGIPGDEKQIAIQVSDVSEDSVIAYELEIQLDTEIVAVKQVISSGTITGDAGFAVVSNLEQKGYIAVSAAGTAQTLTGEGVLLYLSIELLQPGSTPMAWQKVTLFDIAGTPADLDQNDGSVQVDPHPEAPDKVMLDSPANETVIGDDEVALSWYAPGESVSFYTLAIASDPDFQNIVYINDSVTDTSYVFTGFENETTYWWRVRAHNEAGVGEYSDSRMFEILVVGVDDNLAEIPDRYALYQNYPNPFNPSTHIRFGIPERSRVRIEIYNSIGQYIKTLVNEILESGNHEAIWHADRSRVPSGIYMYRMTAVLVLDPGNEFTEVQSMVLVK